MVMCVFVSSTVRLFDWLIAWHTLISCTRSIDPMTLSLPPYKPKSSGAASAATAVPELRRQDSKPKALTKSLISFWESVKGHSNNDQSAPKAESRGRSWRSRGRSNLSKSSSSSEADGATQWETRSMACGVLCAVDVDRWHRCWAVGSRSTTPCCSGSCSSCCCCYYRSAVSVLLCVYYS